MVHQEVEPSLDSETSVACGVVRVWCYLGGQRVPEEGGGGPPDVEPGDEGVPRQHQPLRAQ